MAKVGYIMATSQYDQLEEDRNLMKEFGCVRILDESDDNARHRPLWKQLMAALQRGDELVIPKFTNALRGSLELAIFLEFCRVKVIRIISIHDRIDSSNILFPETKPSDVLVMMGSLPDEVLDLRKSAEHVIKHFPTPCVAVVNWQYSWNSAGSRSFASSASTTGLTPATSCFRKPSHLTCW